VSATDAVCILGTGASTSVGESAPATAAAVRAALSAFHEHPFAVDKEGAPMIVARAGWLPDESAGVSRYADLARPALREALLPLPQGLGGGVGLFLGLPAQRPGRPGGLEDGLKAALTESLPERTTLAFVRTIPAGHASGLIAIQEAAACLQLGKAEFCLVGGVESYLDPDSLEWIDANDQLHSEENSWGFVPGEAAAFCLLARTREARRRSLAARAEIVTTGVAREKNLIKTETVCLGQGLTRAMQEALRTLDASAKVDYQICDLNGESYRADELGFAVARLGASFADPAECWAPADCWGDVGAASGVLFLMLAVAGAEKGYAAGRHALLWASSESGERAATLVRAEVAPWV
jgi:3-oxoacyl-[acyl-carrier-protein] synthase-1